MSKLFGVDAALSAKLERTLRLTRAIEQAALSLDQDVRQTCSALAGDLGANPAGNSHPCEQVALRVQQLREQLGPTGFSLSVRGLSCSVPKDALESCAGACLTGQSGVMSAVSCEAISTAGAPACGLSFSLPNSGAECVAECAASSLHAVRCSAEVDVKLGSGAVSAPELVAMAEGLRRDLPRLYGLATSVGPRSAALVKDVSALVDEAAASIDQLSEAKPALDRQAVAGALLATCLGPELAATLRAGASLQSALSGVVQAHASFAAL